MKRHFLSSACWAVATAWLLSQSVASAQNAISFNFCKDLTMMPSELAGAEARVGSWNNLKDVKANATTTLNAINDNNGKPVPGATAAITGGSSAFETNSVDWEQSGVVDDAKMFNGIFDQDENTATTIVVTNIPYAKYDVYFYRCDDNENADKRAGKFQVGNVTLFARGGKGNPTADGKGYIRSKSTSQGTGANIQQGNYVKFENVSGKTLNATFVAVPGGDDAKRNKVCGFQIVEKK